MDDLNGTIDPRCLAEPPLAMDVISRMCFFYLILGDLILGSFEMDGKYSLISKTRYSILYIHLMKCRLIFNYFNFTVPTGQTYYSCKNIKH